MAVHEDDTELSQATEKKDPNAFRSGRHAPKKGWHTLKISHLMKKVPKAQTVTTDDRKKADGRRKQARRTKNDAEKKKHTTKVSKTKKSDTTSTAKTDKKTPRNDKVYGVKEHASKHAIIRKQKAVRRMKKQAIKKKTKKKKVTDKPTVQNKVGRKSSPKDVVVTETRHAHQLSANRGDMDATGPGIDTDTGRKRMMLLFSEGHGDSRDEEGRDHLVHQLHDDDDADVQEEERGAEEEEVDNDPEEEEEDDHEEEEEGRTFNYFTYDDTN